MSVPRRVWGLRLHLLCTLHGLPVGFAVSGAKADERQVLLGILAADPTLIDDRAGQTVIADKHYYGRAFQAALAADGLILLRATRAKESPGPVPTCSSRCVRWSSRSTTPSKASSTSNNTAAIRPPASGCAFCSASSP